MASSSLPLRLPLPNSSKNPTRSKHPSPFLLRRLAVPPSLRLPPASGAPLLLRRRVAADGERTGEPKWREVSSMPDEFRPHLYNVPEPPRRWLWLIPVPFLIYTWRVVIWELSNWKNIIFPILGWVGNVGKPFFYMVWSVIYLVYMCFAIPATALIVGTGACLDIVKLIYSNTVAYAPVQELCTIIILSSIVVAISEAASRDSVNEQPYLLNAAALVGFGAASGFVSKELFWLSLVGFFVYSRFFKKRDSVAAALPPVAVLVAIGEPWIRALAMTAFIAHAIIHHSMSPQDSVLDGTPRSQKSLPFPLVFAALAIGIHVAAKWIRYRHLTWMIV